MIGAGALVREGAEIPEGSVVVGVPGKVIKQADASRQQQILNNAASYVLLAEEYAHHG
jgi:carbonic anhydrase/acetyltransferase-like protein (isoleucine patch superfamily)